MKNTQWPKYTVVPPHQKQLVNHGALQRINREFNKPRALNKEFLKSPRLPKQCIQKSLLCVSLVPPNYHIYQVCPLFHINITSYVKRIGKQYLNGSQSSLLTVQFNPVLAWKLEIQVNSILQVFKILPNAINTLIIQK